MDDEEEVLGCLEDYDKNLIDWREMNAKGRAVESVAAMFPPSDKDIPAYHCPGIFTWAGYE